MPSQKQPKETPSTSSAGAAWQACLTLIRAAIDERAFTTWFVPIKAVGLQGFELTLQVPTAFFYEWLEENYLELLTKTIRKVLGREGRLAYQVQVVKPTKQQEGSEVHLSATQTKKPSPKGNSVAYTEDFKNPFNPNPYAAPGLKRIQIDPQLNAGYTFESCVEGDFNRVARSAGMAVAQKPGQTAFNPMVVFGPTGCGKTHLAQAIGNQVRVAHPSKTVLYVSAEKFINQFMEHSRTGRVNDFVHFYQLIDVLIVDDIHFFVPALKTQKVFFSIFNHLHQNNKQIILTSDTPPNNLEGVEERLLSRFRWALNAEMTAPDLNTRQEILHRMMKRDGLEIPSEVVGYIAQNVQSSIRDLEGALISLLAQATLNKKDVDLDLTRSVIRNFVKAPPTEITLEHIQKVAATFFDLPYERISTRTRQQDAVRARQVCMYLSKTFTPHSLKAIGAHFGGYDHTTVLHALKTVENLMTTDADFRKQIEELKVQVQVFEA
jgi:chromosomal replication initiator protein